MNIHFQRAFSNMQIHNMCVHKHINMHEHICMHVSMNVFDYTCMYFTIIIRFHALQKNNWFPGMFVRDDLAYLSADKSPKMIYNYFLIDWLLQCMFINLLVTLYHDTLRPFEGG